MTTEALANITTLLARVAAPGAFCARRTASAEDLHLEVRGVGPLRFPISRTRARELCRIARPARYGKGEETLLDPGVRHTWEIPKSRVRIDRRRWNRTLLPVLDGLRADLGLPEGQRLKAELHSMLVYAPGHFFLPHQDSEKGDDMVGTLVVTLPSAFKGGAFVVEHQGEKVTYRATRKPLSFVAFYADCRHEVRPVKEGYRVTLTYNLMLEGDGSAAIAAVAEESGEEVAALAGLLRQHFETPLPPSPYARKGAPPREPPSRLVYLLDHQYTERSLGWNRLKGDDAVRVATLRAAAERASCEAVLALAEVHEVWGCLEEDWWEPRYRRHRRWQRDEDDEWYEEEPPPPAPAGPERYELQDLHDWSITLQHWLDPTGQEGEPLVSGVEGHEVCATTPSSDLEPYASEYEGYMGNWGNTMDRWYRRGAVVLWPRERTFAVRAEASPLWALETLQRRIGSGAIAEAREMVATLLPFWSSVAGREERRGFFDRALRVAHGLDQAALATALLQPFRVEALKPGLARPFTALVERYGESWGRSLLSQWSDPERSWRRSAAPDELRWLAALPRLCAALSAVAAPGGSLAARLLLEDRWQWLRREAEERRGRQPPSRRQQEVDELAKPILGLLGGVAVAGATELGDEAVAYLTAGDDEAMLRCLMIALREAAEKEPQESRAAMGLEALRDCCARLLEARLATPARAAGDWSIPLPPGCRCELCRTLGEFLGDRDRARMEWKLAKQGRAHVHGRIGAHELPVDHQTRRSGSPYTLVLTKTKALFEREAARRRRWQSDRDWLAAQG